MSETISHGEKKRYMIINTWQKIDDPENNLMGFEINKRAKREQ